VGTRYRSCEVVPLLRATFARIESMLAVGAVRFPHRTSRVAKRCCSSSWSSSSYSARASFTLVHGST
jgi:hypothetical protein